MTSTPRKENRFIEAGPVLIEGEEYIELILIVEAEGYNVPPSRVALAKCWAIVGAIIEGLLITLNASEFKLRKSYVDERNEEAG